MSALRGPHDRPRPAIGMGSFEMAQRSGVRSGVLMMAERAFWMECSCSFAYFWNLVFSELGIFAHMDEGVQVGELGDDSDS